MTAEEYRLEASKPSKVLISCFASELLHMIFQHLKPTEAASLRLVSSDFAQIGFHYLTSDVALIVKEDSFDRLLAISEHPILSRPVTALYYDTDLLRILGKPEWVDQLRTSSPCLVLRASYQSYQGYCVTQRHIINSNFYADKMTAALKGFPNLKTLKISCGGEGYGNTRNFNRAFGVHCLVYHETLKRELPQSSRGVGQIRALFQIVDQVGLQIETFECGTVSWKILRQRAVDFAAMKRVMRGVRDLNLSFSTNTDLDYGLRKASSESPNESAEYITQSGRVIDLVTSAAELKSLVVGFDNRELYIFDNTVGNFRWLSLVKVSFFGFSASEDDLIQFVERHASTLKDMSMANMNIHQGTWESFVGSMCKKVMLDRFRLARVFKVQGLGGAYERCAEDFSFPEEDPGASITS